ERLRSAERKVSEVAGLLRATPDEVPAALERKLDDYKALESKLRASEQAGLAAQARSLVASASGGRLVARVDGLEADRLRALAVEVRQAGALDTVVLGGSPDGSKAALVAVVAKGASPTAPELISGAARTVGGGGGGKNPEQAMAGGRDATKLDEALDQV